MKTSELQNIIDRPLTKVRRWVRDSLPTDPLAQARSGYVREFSNEEGFLVYIFGWLIERRKYSASVAREIIDIIKPWVLKYVTPVEDYLEDGQSWELYISMLQNSGISVDAMSRIESTTSIDADPVPPPNKMGRIVDYRLKGRIEKVSGSEPVECLEQAGNWEIIIPISSLASSYSKGMKK